MEIRDCQRERALAMFFSSKKEIILINICVAVPRKLVGVTCFDYLETSHRKWQIISCIQRRKSVAVSAIYLGITWLTEEPQDTYFQTMRYDMILSRCRQTIGWFDIFSQKTENDRLGMSLQSIWCTPLIQETLDLQHMLFTLTFDGKLLNCPMTSPRRVLDAGTGTGVWAIDFG
jgi:hypothetical protein